MSCLKWMKRVTGAAFAASALLAICLTLKIYFGYDGSGQMYTAGVVSKSLQILRLPLLFSILCAAITAVLSRREPNRQPPTRGSRYPEIGKLRYVSLAAGGLAILYMLVYCCSISNFESRDLEATVGRMLLHFAPASVILLISAYFLQKKVSPKPEKANNISITGLQIAIFVVSIVCILIGIFNGGMRDVLVKAINICTECIGLG